VRGFRYSDWDEELFREAKEQQGLRDLFNFLLLKTNGDPERALDLMRELQGQRTVRGAWSSPTRA
jgi:hypothetical protein